MHRLSSTRQFARVLLQIRPLACVKTVKDDENIFRFFLAGRGDVTDDQNAPQKRKQNLDDASCGAKRMKRVGDVSHSQYEKLKRENIQLKKDLRTLQANWMRRFPLRIKTDKPSSFLCLAKPVGAAALYFVDMGRVLSGKPDGNDDEMERGDLLETICATLKMTENELK